MWMHIYMQVTFFEVISEHIRICYVLLSEFEMMEWVSVLF